MNKPLQRFIFAIVIATLHSYIAIASTEDDLKDVEKLQQQKQETQQKIQKVNKLLNPNKSPSDLEDNKSPSDRQNEKNGANKADSQNPENQPKSGLLSLPLSLLIGFPVTLSSISLFILYRFGILKDLISRLTKEPISDNIKFIHNRALGELKELAKKLESLDHDKFSGQEFLLFIKIKMALKRGDNQYQKLDLSVKLLEAAIAAQASYLSLEQTELRFRSSAQQEFYNYVAGILKQNLETNKFKELIKKKISETLPILNTEEGREALQSYLKYLNTIAEHEFGLKLLSLFKEYQLTDFSIIRTVAETVNKLERKSLFDLKELNVLVMVDYDVFKKLGPILGFTRNESTPETYARMLQVIGLEKRHQISFVKFKELITLLKKWYKPYHFVTTIREEYPSEKYHQSKEFTEEIPGINIYKKYEDYFEGKELFSV
jgi:hypothetical protein